MEQVRLCAVWPMKDWLGTFRTTLRVGWMIWICYSRALERRPLVHACKLRSLVNIKFRTVIEEEEEQWSLFTLQHAHVLQQWDSVPAICLLNRIHQRVQWLPLNETQCLLVWTRPLHCGLLRQVERVRSHIRRILLLCRFTLYSLPFLVWKTLRGRDLFLLRSKTRSQWLMRDDATTPRLRDHGKDTA